MSQYEEPRVIIRLTVSAVISPGSGSPPRPGAAGPRQQVQQWGRSLISAEGPKIKRTSGAVPHPETRRAARSLKPLVFCWQSLPNLQPIKIHQRSGGMSSSLMTSQSKVSWLHLMDREEIFSFHIHQKALWHQTRDDWLDESSDRHTPTRPTRFLVCS